MKKHNLIVLSSLALVSTLALSTPAFASTETTQETLVQRLVRIFKLDQKEVDKTVDQFRTEKQAMMQEKIEARLSTLVSEGKITEDQKAKILAKHKEMFENRPSREEMQNMTQEERQAQREEKRTELENWAKENGIDLKYLFMGKMGNGMGYGKGWGDGQRGPAGQVN